MNEETLFAAALELTDRSEREAFLSQVCEYQPQLRAQVDELLEAHEQSNALLDDPTGAAQFELDTDDDTIDLKTSHREFQSLPAFDPCDTPDRMGQLGDYEIIELIGQGGMGHVFRAWDTRLNREVALKVTSQDVGRNPQVAKRFLREARSAAAVKHDHVVTIYAIDHTYEPPLLAMELVDGETLQQRITREGPLPVTEIVRIGQQMAAGLAAAHSQGLIHRDVKPGNVLLEKGTGRAKITDFGLARATDNPELTQDGVILGTPQYMSPEQTRGEVVDHRSDLFSLGSVLYAMCTGQPAFQSETNVGTMHRVCHDTPTRIRDLNPQIPRWLQSIVDRLLDKEPGRRYQTSEELTAALTSKHPGGMNSRLRQRMKTFGLVTLGLLGMGVVAKMSGIIPLPRVSSNNAATTSASKEDRLVEPSAEGEEEAVVAPGVAESTWPQVVSFPPRRKWAEPVRLKGIDHYNRAIAMSDDGLSLALSSPHSNGFGGYDLFTQSRPAITEPFGKQTNLGAGINGGFNERFPAFFRGGLQLIYWTTRPPSSPSPAGLMQSTRRSLDEPFVKAEPVAFDGDERFWESNGLTASVDGLTVILSSAGPDASGNPDLWRLSRNSPDGDFGAPVKLSSLINSSGQDTWPCLADGGRSLFFTSNRDTRGEAIWKCSRPSVDQPFAAPKMLNVPINLRGISSRSPSLSADGSVLIYRSYRDERKATIPPPPFWQSERLPPTAADILTSPDWVWTTAEPLGPEVNPSDLNATHPALSDDGCTLIYSINSYTHYVSTRESIDKRFGKRRRIGHSGSGFAVAPGGLMAVFCSARNSSAAEGWRGDIYFTKRASVGEPFETEQLVEFDSDVSGWSLQSPYLTGDGLTMYFDSSGPPENSRFKVRLWISTRESLDDPFGKPVQLPGKINGYDKSMSPHVTADGCVMIFTLREHKDGDLWMSSRSSPELPFGAPVKLPPSINVDRFNDRSPTLSADGKVLIYSSNRDGKSRLWQSRRVLKSAANR